MRENRLGRHQWLAARPHLYDLGRWGMRPRVYSPSSRVPHISAVYALLNDSNDILYIGMTIELPHRLVAHWRQDRVPFTRVVWRQAPERVLETLEAYLIGQGIPPYNRKFCCQMETEHRKMSEAIAGSMRVLGGSFPWEN